MADTRLADVSEFQQSIDAPAYLGASKCLIVRAHNGFRPDNCWPARRDYLRAHPFVALGFYQYVVSSRDASSQAAEFIRAVGPLRGNEFPVLDIEEGTGNQTGRAQAWLKVVDGWCGFPATIYAGEAFFQHQLGGSARWRGRPRWMAAYRTSEPSDPHELWQNTDKARFPGLAGAVDGNLFHGTGARFLAVMRPGSVGPPAARPPAGRGGSLATVVNRDGRIETFEEAASGEVVHKWQTAADNGWTERWQSLGTPGR